MVLGGIGYSGYRVGFQPLSLFNAGDDDFACGGFVNQNPGIHAHSGRLSAAVNAWL